MLMVFSTCKHTASIFGGLPAFQGRATRWRGALALSRLTHLLEEETEMSMWKVWPDKLKSRSLNGKGGTYWA